jgi:hypothetical protein
MRTSPGAAGLLEPGGDVHRITRREDLACTHRDLAGVDACPELEPDAVRCFELVVERRHLLIELERGSHGTKRAVLVDDRDAEHGHHRVSDELLDRATVPAD